jgi:hypothetical protein
MAKYRFKLLAGHYSFNANEAEDQKLLASGLMPKAKIVEFLQGDEFETDQPLDEMFNHPGSKKFERIYKEVEDTEESLAVEERRLAERKAKLAAKATSVVEAAQKGFRGEDDVNKMTFVELQELAESNGITYGKVKSREELLKIVKAAFVSA